MAREHYTRTLKSWYSQKPRDASSAEAPTGGDDEEEVEAELLHAAGDAQHGDALAAAGQAGAAAAEEKEVDTPKDHLSITCQPDDDDDDAAASASAAGNAAAAAGARQRASAYDELQQLAALLMQERKDPVTEASYDVGYPQDDFVTTFKRNKCSIHRSASLQPSSHLVKASG